MKKENPNAINRRQFLTRASVLSAAVVLPRYVMGCKALAAPGDQITLGFIGTGKQAMGLQDSFLKTGEVRILAAADVYEAKLHRFTEKLPGCDMYSDFRRILDRKDINAVVIATPDHWHAAIAVMAAKAGKDIYCEKPLSLTIKEGRAMVKAAREHKRVFQTGSMQRSWAEFRQAVELVRNGYIGEIKTVRVNVGPPPIPYNLPQEPMPAGLNWDMWLGPNVKPQVFNHNLAPGLTDDFWAHWRDYREFGGGGMTDWGAHMFDIAQWGLDMDGSGPVLITPPDKDHKFLTYRYANGITMTHEPEGNQGVTFVGTKGDIHVVRGKLETNPGSLLNQTIGDNEKHVYRSDDHYKDFLQAIRKRTKPVADVEIGHRTATVCNLGNIAYELNRPLKWDPAKEVFLDDDEANKLTGREMKKEWNVL
ncbi:Gfo/Idh/MocA family protein [Mucilaginibacter ginsenosidivorans]|uniref:Gfo/Idh/MocA family oxidoreductase n=1 Tax=Mucilaginibacter ginsenosidivorans TaxID=398053 RepID=A0A5B8V167_9SPHI|nr:Gfo/Idh/MocA family oxidoreductase [Mucilaginibacter ginsenosidivorans]QEC65012.1 Gfo/Idh/MocA family oxidoreductase [Mucilaginibacter ginsenosidivorans]